jgi:putative membrane protein
MRLISYLLVNGLAVIVAAYVIPGVRVDSLVTAGIVAVVLGLMNTFLKPVLVILTLPITVLTLGLFLLILNAIIVSLTSMFVPGFHVENFWSALIFSIVLSIVSWFLNSLVGKE